MLIFKLIVGLVINMAIFGGLLFVPAGTWEWRRAWVFLGTVFVSYVAMAVYVFPCREDLLNERFKPPIQKGQPLADKVIVILFIVTFLGLIVFIPLDVFRLHLMDKPGMLVSSFGLVLFVAGWWIICFAFKENSFAAPVVKHQKQQTWPIRESTAWCDIRCTRALSSWSSACPCGWNHTQPLCWRAFQSGRSLCGSRSKSGFSGEN